jgi:hypothetical protein
VGRRPSPTPPSSAVPLLAMKAANDEVAWTVFELDGLSLEYITFPSSVRTRPKGWPSHKPAPGRPEPVVFLSVRKVGDAEGGVGEALPAGTSVMVEHAIALARQFWQHLK